MVREFSNRPRVPIQTPNLLSNDIHVGSRWWDLHYEIKTTNLGSSTFVPLPGDPGPPNVPYLTQSSRALETPIARSDEGVYDCRDIHNLGIERNCDEFLIRGRCREPYVLKGGYCAMTCNTCDDTLQLA